MGYDIRASSAGCSRNTFGELDFESIILSLRCNSISGVVRDSGLNKLCRQILASLIILFQGCIATNEALWPANIPHREYFESIYSGDKDNQLVQSKAGYLQWVVSFYEGTLIAPVGWLSLQSTVLEMADPKDRLELGNRLTTLGRLISGEWAKENDKRMIDSRMLSLWGSIMQLVDDPRIQGQAVALIEKDVKALLDRQLTPEAIVDERYEKGLGIVLFEGF